MKLVMTMDVERAAKKWLGEQLVWEVRLDQLRTAYAERHGLDTYPDNTSDERAARDTCHSERVDASGQRPTAAATVSQQT